jgi:transcriptional regulator with XRE-family HTH domain
MDASQNDLIGKRVRFYRTSRNLSLEGLAEKLPTALSIAQLAKYEAGQSRWPADLMCATAAALGVGVLQLLMGDELRELELKGEAWKAEQCRQQLLQMKPKQRQLIYQVIESIVNFF